MNRSAPHVFYYLRRTLQMAFAAMKEWKGDTLEGLIVQGGPYTSNDYLTAILESQAFASSSRSAIPGDNPVNESFFSGFQAEWSEQVVEMKIFEMLRQLIIRTTAIPIRRDII